jgi:hypothetical protein
VTLKNRWCGIAVVDMAWAEKYNARESEFIALSDANGLDQEEERSRGNFNGE